MSSFLRTRYRALHDRFGTAGVIIAVLALVVALGGTALAAGGLTKAQEKQVKKIAQKYAGKPGAPGAAGTNGTNGTNGKDGAPGKNGESVTLAAAGSCANGGTKVTVASTSKEICNGAPGSPGAPGDSPEAVALLQPGEEGCAAGGVLYEVPSTGDEAPVCNGEKGAKGDEGSPWTDGGTLPPGATETGTWAFTGTTANTNGIRVPISFPIRLAAELPHAAVHIAPAAGCPGNAAHPAAEPGQLCVYQNNFESVQNTTFQAICKPVEETIAHCLINEEEEEPGAATTGAVLVFSAPTGEARGAGTFAVRAPAP